MFFVSRPLTLLAFAICAYVTITWKLHPSKTTEILSVYDENGFTNYIPREKEKGATPKSKSEAGGSAIGKAGITGQNQQTLPAVATDGFDLGSFRTADGDGSATVKQAPLATLAATYGVDHEEYMKDILDWERPKHKNSHWPPYEDFVHKDYDPNRWEAFRTERGFFVKSGIDRLTPAQIDSIQTYLPYPDYNSKEWEKSWLGKFTPCNGPRGKPLTDGMLDTVRVYPVTPSNFPQSFSGSAEAIGLDDSVCVDRVQRYGPYGFNPLLRIPISLVDWAGVSWGVLQNDCLSRNKDRFAPVARNPPKMVPDFSKPEGPMTESSPHEEIRREATSESQKPESKGLSYRPRTAVLIRTWEGYNYAENDILAIRSMVSELSLRTGGEYQVFLFVNIKDKSQPIFTDRQAYKRMLNKHVPRELRDIAILWNEELCKSSYPEVGDWQVYWHQFMPVQWFSTTHPEFDYVWNWEMDVRYIGNHYHFLSKIGDFAKKQPRKYLWERNARFYIPSYHGRNYETYVKDTNAIIYNASATNIIPTPVWGPQPYSPGQTPLGPTPPHSQEKDDFTWGVNEEADLITLLPIWDPINTTWTMRNKIWNFTPGVRPNFNREHPTDDEFFDPNEANIPRRAFINTVMRFSRELLLAMHAENAAGRTMQAEMWPTTVSLHHGFKAVYAPHPIYSSVKWPARYADAVFNADGGVPGRWGQGPDSIYNQDREVNFRAWSWYYHATFPRVLYRRWMGWHAKDALGEVGGWEWERGEKGPGGRMCLPPMLLHPVKRRDLESNM